MEMDCNIDKRQKTGFTFPNLFQIFDILQKCYKFHSVPSCRKMIWYQNYKVVILCKLCNYLNRNFNLVFSIVRAAKIFGKHSSFRSVAAQFSRNKPKVQYSDIPMLRINDMY